MGFSRIGYLAVTKTLKRFIYNVVCGFFIRQRPVDAVVRLISPLGYIEPSLRTLEQDNRKHTHTVDTDALDKSIAITFLSVYRVGRVISLF